MSDALPGTTTVTPATTEPAKADDIPAWAKALQESVTKLSVTTDKRFEGVSERMRGKLPETTTAPAANAAAVTQSDLDASIRYGELRGSLPEPQRAQLESLRQDGLGFAQLAKIAEGFKAALPANGGGTAERSAPPGTAANAAPSTALRFPESQSELLALKIKDRKAYDAVWAHPDFDPKLLRRN